MTWSDRYATLFGLALGVAVLGHPVTTALQGLSAGADASRLSAGLALVMVAYAGYLTLARLLGPVALPAADATWLVMSPLPRRSVLGRAASVLLVVAVAGGAVGGLAVLSVLGAPDNLVLRLATALVVGAGAGVGGMAMAILAQASAAWDPWLQVAIAGAVLMAVVVAVVGIGPARQVLTTVAGAPTAFTVAAAGLATATAGVLLRRAWVALDRIPARRILSSSVRGGRVVSAAVTMDPGALTWNAEDNHWRGRVLASRPWPGFTAPDGRGAALAPAWQEWRRVGRRPGRLAVLSGSAALPAMAAQAAGGMSALSIGVLLGGALAAAVACTTGARRDNDNPSLARLLAVDGRALMAARALLPALMAGLWSTLALAGLVAVGALPGGPWWLLGPAVAPALAAAALRMACRRPVDHSMPVIDTPVGSLPAGPVIWALTGVDLALLGCLPTLAALTGPTASPIPSVIIQVLVGGGVLTAFLLRRGRGGRTRGIRALWSARLRSGRGSSAR